MKRSFIELYRNVLAFPKARKYQGLKRVNFSSKNDWGSAIIGSDFMVICIMGSDDTKDWIGNLKVGTEALHESCPDLLVHKGFNEGQKNLYPRVREIIGQFENRRKVYFTSHSRGSAIAKLLILRLMHVDGKNVNEFQSIGEPRSCMGKANRVFEELPVFHLRWVNAKDAVPTIPPGWSGYKHSGDLIRLKARRKWSWLFYRRWDDHDSSKYELKMRNQYTNWISELCK